MIKKVTIGEVFEFVRNGASIKQDDNKSGYPITRIESIWNESIDDKRFGYADIFDKELLKYEKYLLEEGDILMTHINSPKHLGKSAMYSGFPEKLIHGMNLLCLRPNKKNSNSRYLKHYLNSSYFKELLPKISNQSVNQASFSAGNLKSLEIPLPPLPQQQKIANILDAAVTLKQNDKALIAKYDALTQALFLEMFGDPVSNPKGWEKVEMKNLTQPIKKLGKDYKSPSINYVDISSIDNTKFLIVSTTEYLFEERPSRAQQILKKNDVLLSTVRPNLKNIAINKTDDLIASTGFYVCRVNEQLNSKFLFEVLKSDSVTNHFVGITAGANYPAVKSSDISKFQVVLPPIELQNQFAERVALIEEQKAIAQKSLEKSEALCNSLLQKAFNGGLT